MKETAKAKDAAGDDYLGVPGPTDEEQRLMRLEDAASWRVNEAEAARDRADAGQRAVALDALRGDPEAVAEYDRHEAERRAAKREARMARIAGEGITDALRELQAREDAGNYDRRRAGG